MVAIRNEEQSEPGHSGVCLLLCEYHPAAQVNGPVVFVTVADMTIMWNRAADTVRVIKMNCGIVYVERDGVVTVDMLDTADVNALLGALLACDLPGTDGGEMPDISGIFDE